MLLGFQARLAALGLAVFSLMTELLFLGGTKDAIHFMKNMAMTGVLLFFILHGAGKFSMDYMIENRDSIWK